MRRLRLGLVTAVLSAALLAPSTASALVRSNAWYNSWAWTWSYYSAATSRYNCLAYSLGYTDRWIWPWLYNPSAWEVDNFMNIMGYHAVSRSGSPTIIAYARNGNMNAIGHFSRVISSSATRAKWGSLECMTSYSWSPYYWDTYGPSVRFYRR